MDLGKQGAAERVRAGEGRRVDRGVVVGAVANLVDNSVLEDHRRAFCSMESAVAETVRASFRELVWQGKLHSQFRSAGILPASWELRACLAVAVS